MIVLDLDATDENADWIKRGAVDLPGADTEEGLRTTLAGLGLTVAQFKKTQVYLAHREQFLYLDGLATTSRVVDGVMARARQPR